MKILMSAEHLARYKQIAMLLWKYGRSDLVHQMGIGDTIERDSSTKWGVSSTPRSTPGLRCAAT